MEVDIIRLATQCPDITISVKASDLLEAGRTIAEDIISALKDTESAKPITQEDSFLSREETMTKLGVSSATLWRWKKCGYLVPVQLGSMDRYRLSDINGIILKKGGSL